MKKRKWNICSLVPILCALLFQFGALHEISQSIELRAKLTKLRTELEVIKMKSDASTLITLADVLRVLGFVFAAGSLLSCYISAKASEPGSRAVLYGLYAFFLLTQFLLT
jgi:hypothetical protein